MCQAGIIVSIFSTGSAMEAKTLAAKTSRLASVSILSWRVVSLRDFIVFEPFSVVLAGLLSRLTVKNVNYLVNGQRL